MTSFLAEIDCWPGLVITRERLNDEVIALFQRKGFAGLFITHSITEAVFLSTRVVVMSARPGRILDEFVRYYDEEQLTDLLEFARRHDLWIISDEVYEHLVFDGEPHASAINYPELRERAFSIAEHKHDYGFFLDLFTHTPAMENVSDEGGSLGDISGSFVESVRAARQVFSLRSQLMPPVAPSVPWSNWSAAPRGTTLVSPATTSTRQRRAASPTLRSTRRNVSTAASPPSRRKARCRARARRSADPAHSHALAQTAFRRRYGASR